jgi:hypothetical protein
MFSIALCLVVSGRSPPPTISTWRCSESQQCLRYPARIVQADPKIDAANAATTAPTRTLTMLFIHASSEGAAVGCQIENDVVSFRLTPDWPASASLATDELKQDGGFHQPLQPQDNTLCVQKKSQLAARGDDPARRVIPTPSVGKRFRARWFCGQRPAGYEMTKAGPPRGRRPGKLGGAHEYQSTRFCRHRRRHVCNPCRGASFV